MPIGDGVFTLRSCTLFLHSASDLARDALFIVALTMPRQPKIKRKGHAEFLAGIDLATTPYKQLVKLAKRAKLDSKGKSEVLRAALNGQWRDSIQNNQHLNVFTAQRPGNVRKRPAKPVAQGIRRPPRSAENLVSAQSGGSMSKSAPSESCSPTVRNCEFGLCMASARHRLLLALTAEAR